MSDERYQRGLNRLKELEGPEVLDWVDELTKSHPALARLTVEYPYGDIWTRPGISDRDREIAVIASLTALGNSENELASHIVMARKVGLTKEEIMEIIILMSVYAGFPVALKALETAKSVFGDDMEGQGP